MINNKYKGIGLIGNDNISGIYAVNNGIVDINGTGIYHLFYKSYDHDILQSASTIIKIKDTLYYGNKKWQSHTHPIHLEPVKTEVKNGFMYCDTFDISENKFTKLDTVYAYGKGTITFETEINNYGTETLEVMCYGYIAVRNDYDISCRKVSDNLLRVTTNKANIAMITEAATEQYLVVDSPTDFSYETFLNILNNTQTEDNFTTNCRLGCAQGYKITINPGENKSFKWSLVFKDTKEEIESLKDKFNLKGTRAEALDYWSTWLKKGENNYSPIVKTTNKDIKLVKDDLEDLAKRNLIAIKAVLLDGNVPADLTGHYFANKMPCYYARDSIMVARALLLAGHYDDCEQILRYLIKRKRKENGEFYQRYDGKGEPNQGANNNVFHQTDSIGYFCRIVYELYKRTKKLIVDLDFLKELVDVIRYSEKKNGMVGPEGGVNEGVFGPAFITSSNMFIYGGIKAAEELFNEFNEVQYSNICNKVCKDIYEGIQSTFDYELKRYNYGYVTYHDKVVRKYDTPQYFGPLYGYPNDKNMQLTHSYFLKNASFFENGIGYSEQEYHHGPWLFNTAACAEYSALTCDYENYIKKIRWISNHTNAYGLIPEAIDANNENISFINPLTWACAEFVASYYIINNEV
ncbi:hypothetical protein [uncultured Clostridium sp.]|uniref:hypothetical protein n=1 Tax=uncultured Clostridium sp. TaxID=59620 RepID=UPI0028EB5264|nr:hypothetical protein [uncultured Clostridium sp.]